MSSEAAAPGGPIINPATGTGTGVSSKSPPPIAARPIKPGNNAQYKTMPVAMPPNSSSVSSTTSPPPPSVKSPPNTYKTMTPQSTAGTKSPSPPLTTNSSSTTGTIAAPPTSTSASLASFYGMNLHDNDDDVNSSAEGQPAPTTATSATSFYAMAAAQPTPTNAQQTKPLSPTSHHSSSLSTGDLPSPIHRSISPAATGSPTKSVLATIASKFDHPPIDLTGSSKRQLVKEGYLMRQATFKNVERYVYLFNDLLIVTEPVVKPTNPSSATLAAPKLIMKQIVSLDQASISPGKKPTIFIVENPEKPLYFECSTTADATDWVGAITAAIDEYKALLSKSAVPSSSSSSAPDPNESLFTAVAKKNEELLLYLLSERGDDANQLDTAGHTPLHRAVLNGFVSGVTLLLGHGADATIANPDGKTSLHLAALNDAYGILIIFLSRKPDLDKLLDMDGRSPLWDLVQGPYKLHEKLVLDETVNAASSATSAPTVAASPLSKRGRPKKRPVVGASPRSSEELTDSGNSSSDDDDDEDDEDDEKRQSTLSPAEKDLLSREQMQRDSWKNLVECLNVMIEENVDIDARDHSGRTLLMHLASTHSHESLELLISKGASLTLIDDNGCTVLHYAVCPTLSYGRVDDNELGDVILTIQALLQAGVCPNLRTHEGNTALHLCKSIPIAGCLIVHGARPELKNEAGVKASAYFEELASKGDLNDPLGAIKDARDQWASRPDTFLPPNEDLEANSWLGDELSDCCLLCSEKFSLTRRRHHCRRCGMLVCAYCSSKKFTNVKKKEEGLRACDGCYNFMAHAYLKYARVQRRAAAKKREAEAQLARERAEVNAAFDASHQQFLRHQKEEETRIAEKLKRIEENKLHPENAQPPPMIKRSSVNAGSSSSSSSSSSTSDRTKSAQNRVAGANEVMQQNRQLAIERGEKLSRMEDKAARMEADAQNFADMARKLKEKQKSSWF